MADNWEASDDELSDDEQQLLRFRQEHELPLKAANLGFDMDQLVHIDPAGKHLIQSAIDRMHVCLVMLIDSDLQSAEARGLQVEAKSCRLLIENVIETLENGRSAAFALADTAEIAEE